MNDFAGACVRPEDYQGLRELCPDCELPETYAGWTEFALGQTLLSAQKGAPPSVV